MISPASIKKILWIRPDAIGDALLASSMLPHVKKHFADARLTVLCQNHVMELYQASPLIDEIIGLNKKSL